MPTYQPTVEQEGRPYRVVLEGGGIDVDGDGCRTRCEVFARQRLDDVAGLSAGGWLSIYDGHASDDPTTLEMDHVVALAEAWRSGAWAWDLETRRAFANDEAGLLIVSSWSNQAKSWEMRSRSRCSKARASTGSKRAAPTCAFHFHRASRNGLPEGPSGLSSAGQNT